MKIYFIFAIILLLVEREVNANPDNDFENDAPEGNLEDDGFEEKGVKWNIDLDDMLNFNKHESQSANTNIKHTTSDKYYGGKGQAVEIIRGNYGYDKAIEIIKGNYAYEHSVGEIEDYNENGKAVGEIEYYNENGKAVGEIEDFNDNGNIMEGFEDEDEYEQAGEGFNDFDDNAVGTVKGYKKNKNAIKFYSIKDPVEPDMFKEQIQEYILRYLNLFLYLLNLQDRYIPAEENEDVNVNFDFVISREDLRTLQNMGRYLNNDNILDQLSEIDAIISNGLHVKEKYSFYRDIVSFFRRNDFSKDLFKSKNAYLVIFGTAAFFMILIKNMAGFSYRFIIIVLVNNMIVLEGIFNYWVKVKEAGIADHIEKMRYESAADSCTMDHQTFFARVYNWFTENECFSYHKIMHLNRADKIFPLESIIHAYTFYLVETPFKIIGSGLRAFIVSANEYLPVLIRPFGEVVTQYVAMAFMLLLLMFFFCPNIRFNLWGARVELGFPLWMLNRGRFPEYEGPPEYQRIRELPRSERREIEKEYVQQPPDYLEEGSDSVSEVVRDTGKVEHRQVEESRVEEKNNAIEIVDEDVRSDNKSLVSEERNLSQDIKTAKRLLAELKTSE